MTPATLLFTTLALLAFAANSLLTRMALGPRLLDAATFTGVRLLAGAVVLSLLARGRPAHRPSGAARLGPLALFAYAAPFSYAYLRIGAAVGALVLFGAVQLTMLGWALLRGERPGARGYAGLLLSGLGLVALVLPGVSRPDPLGAALMVLAGVAWAVYSLLGRGAGDPLAANARSFLLSVPLSLLLLAAARAAGGAAPPSVRGLALAVASGAATSGVGYAIWYRALRGLGAAQAGVVQLAVPVLAALGAVVFLGEQLTSRLVSASAAVLGGVLLALWRRRG